MRFGTAEIAAHCSDDSRPGAAKVAILGHELEAPLRIGWNVAAAALDSASTFRVGVAPAGFHFPPNAPTELILPMTVPLQPPAGRKNGWVFAVARLKASVGFDAAQTNLTALSRRFEEQYPADNQGSQYFAVPLRDALVGSSKGLRLLLAAVGWCAHCLREIRDCS